ncbi:MAG: hypothetical protein ACOZF2_06695 [Thermodesulfobacteriota bacterium]
MKKMGLIIMAVCMIVTLGIASAQADWYYCNITGVGVGGSYTYVCLTDTATSPAFTNRWFLLFNTMAKQHLATALTAASTGQTLAANFSGTGVPPTNTTIVSLYLNNGFH